MSDNVQTAMFEILKKMQSDIGGIKDRLDRIENINRKQRRDSAGMLVMMRATAGDFDERVSEVEARVEALEARRT
jgi:hypothetical protein